MSQPLQTLENLIDLLETKTSADEIVDIFKVFLEIAEKVKTDNEEERQEIRSLFRQYETKMEDLHKGMTDDGKKILANLVEKIEEKLNKALDEQRHSLDFIKDKVRKIKEGKDGEDGHTPTKDELLVLINPIIEAIKLPEPEKLSGNNILTKVQELEEGERWRIEDVNGLKNELEKIRKGGKMVMAGISPYQPTTILTATGALDDSNKDFVFSMKPTMINVNGANYVEGHGWSWAASTLTATLDIAPGYSGYVFGII